MKIIVGSKNPVKINAVKECISDYYFLKEANVSGVEADSLVGNQPKTLELTIKGAMNRAKTAFEHGANLGIGIEAGLFKVPYTKTEYMNAEVCAIYDGKEFHLGMSSAFEYPRKVTETAIKENIEISDAAKKCGFTSKTGAEKLGQGEGMIGLLTKGRLNRTTYGMECVRMALIHLENSEHY